MAIVKMKKLSLIVPKENAQKITKELMWLGCVETFPLSAEDFDGLFDEQQANPDITAASKRLEKITVALNSVAKYRKKKGLFASSPDITREEFEKVPERADELYGYIEKISDAKSRQSEIKTRINSIESVIAQLKPWSELEHDVSSLSTNQTELICGTVPNHISCDELCASCEETGIFIEQISNDRESRYLCVYCLKRDSDVVLRTLSAQGFTKIVFPAREGTVKSIISSMTSEIGTLEKETEELEASLMQYSQKSDELELLYDYEKSRLNILDTCNGSLSTETASLIKGWVPEEKVPKLEKLLKGYTCYCELSDPTRDEKPPIELKNNKFASAFEGIIGLYSYPDYFGYDPLKYTAIFYCIIFGLMLADFVYGLLLTVGCFAAIKLMKPGKSMKSFLEMFAWSGVTTAIAGLLFGSIMGDLPSVFNTAMLGGKSFETALWFNPTKDPMMFLYVSFALGFVHLMWGLGLQAYILIKRGRLADAVCDIFTWYLVFLGILIFGAGALTSIAILSEIGKWVLIAGVASIILTQGRAEKNIFMKLAKGVMGLYDIVNYISDLLSYSRILALGLATAVVSSVVNTMATLAGPSVFGFILFVLVIALGHALNLALNVLGSFVHASRLQYIEFFGKFYEDGGKHFTPLNVDAKYTKIKLTEDK